MASRKSRRDLLARVRLPLQVEPLESRIAPAGGLTATNIDDGVRLNLSGQNVSVLGDRPIDVENIQRFFASPNGKATGTAFDG